MFKFNSVLMSITMTLSIYSHAQTISVPGSATAGSASMATGATLQPGLSASSLSGPSFGSSSFGLSGPVMSGPSAFLGSFAGQTSWNPFGVSVSVSGPSGPTVLSAPNPTFSASTASPYSAPLSSILSAAQKAGVHGLPEVKPLSKQTESIKSTADEGAVRIKSGWVVSYLKKEFDPNQTTLVLLPGIYRGLEKDEPVLKMLENLKANFVAIHFSAHAKSIQALNDTEEPIFANGTGLSGKSLAQEVEAVVTHLKIKKPLVISLSYSTVVVPYLNKKIFPYAVETAPMGKFKETNEIGSAFGQFWSNWLTSFSLYGAAYVEALKNQSYYSYWTSTVASLATIRPELRNPIVARRQVDGFVALARAAEDFDLTSEDFQNTPYRSWILGSHEESPRAQYQAEAVKKYLSTLDPKIAESSIFGKKGVFIVEGAGHIIPNEKPAEYVAALFNIVSHIENDKE